MRTFACTVCGQLVFFENTACLHCGAALGFEWSEREIVALQEDGEGGLVPASGAGAPRRRCANAELAGCNWLVAEPGRLCDACALTRTRPADDDASGLGGFRRAEAAKRRLLFELGELGLPVVARSASGDGLEFDLLSSGRGPVTTGHADGLVTLDLAETDDAHRERMRRELGEPYRTLLGHFRHEVGHFYWTVLARDEPRRKRARALFGDERADYGAALERHYANGAPEDWAERHVSAYATMHPAEDWAETFAHYLHIRDTLQTAAAHRVRVLGPEAVARVGSVQSLVSVPREEPRAFDEILDAWLPLTYALNALNRSMGRDDLYPFVLTEPVVEKLALVHDLVADA